MTGRLYSKRAAARFLGCSPTTVYQLIAERKLPVVPKGHREAIRLADLERLASKGWRRSK